MYIGLKWLQKHPNPTEVLLWPKMSMKSHFQAKSREVYWLKKPSFWSKIKGGILAEKGLQKHPNPTEVLLWPTRSVKNHFGAKLKEVY